MGTNKWYDKPGWIIGIAILIPFLLVALTVIVKCCCKVEINCIETVLTLIGILATFVVISSYLQMKSIEDRMKETYDNKLNTIEKQISFIEGRVKNEEELSKKVDSIKTALKNFYDYAMDDSNEGYKPRGIEKLKNI